MPIFFTQPIRHGVACLHSASLRRRTLRPWGLSIETFNIYGGHGIGLVQDIWAVQIGGFDLMVLTERKVTNQAYYHNRLGYYMVCYPNILTEYGGS